MADLPNLVPRTDSVSGEVGAVDVGAVAVAAVDLGAVDSAAARVPAAVAAGDRATADVGVAILRSGGSAADAAVGAMLAACAAETIMTGLGGGGFATHWDARRRQATAVDFFVATPGIGLDRPVRAMTEIEVVFGPQRLEYFVGAGSIAVPGAVFGLSEVQHRWGRLSWAEVVQPAYRLARDGVPMSARKAKVLVDIQNGMINSDEGRAAYAPSGRLLEAGELLRHAGLADAFALLRDEGVRAFRSDGPVGAATLAVSRERGGPLTALDLDRYEPAVAGCRSVRFAGNEIHGRTDLLDLLGTLAALPADVGELDDAARTRAWVRALLGLDRRGGTTNVCAVDVDGDACAITTSLGLGAGEWVPGFGIHLNSMLGEGELMVGSSVPPGSRVHSMMTPVVAVRDGRLSLVAGAAGGSRIRSALVQAMTGVLAEGLPPQVAVDRPRMNPVHGRDGTLVHAEPGYSEDALAALESDGVRVARWPAAAAYFGGVSAIGVSGPAADHRRDGAVGLA